jgi:hypothetical protein
LSGLLLLQIGLLCVSSSSPLLQVADRAALLAGGESVAAAGSLTTGGSATDRLKEMTGLGYSVAVTVEETAEEEAAEGEASDGEAAR